MRQLVFTFILAFASGRGVYALATEIDTVVRLPSRLIPQAGNGADHAMRGNRLDVIRRVDELLPPLESKRSAPKEQPVAGAK